VRRFDTAGTGTVQFAGGVDPIEQAPDAVPPTTPPPSLRRSSAPGPDALQWGPEVVVMFESPDHMIFHVPDHGQDYQIGEPVRVVRSARHVDLISDPSSGLEIARCERSPLDSWDVSFLLVQVRPRSDPQP